MQASQLNQKNNCVDLTHPPIRWCYCLTPFSFAGHDGGCLKLRSSLNAGPFLLRGSLLYSKQSYEVINMHIGLGLSVTNPSRGLSLSDYAVGGVVPSYVLDGERNFYSFDGGDTTLPAILDCGRTSSAYIYNAADDLESVATTITRRTNDPVDGWAILSEDEATNPNHTSGGPVLVEYSWRWAVYRIALPARLLRIYGNSVWKHGLELYLHKGQLSNSKRSPCVLLVIGTGTADVVAFEIDDRDFGGNRFRATYTISTDALSVTMTGDKGDGASVDSYQSIDLGGGLIKLEAILTVGSLATVPVVMLRHGDTGTQLICNVQAEVGSAATSPITVGGSTRAADDLSKSITSLSVSSTATLSFSGITLTDGVAAQVSDGTDNNRLVIRRSGGNIIAEATVGGSAAGTKTTAIAAGTAYKAVVAIAPTSAQATIDGVAATADVITAMPSLTTHHEGQSNAGDVSSTLNRLSAIYPSTFTEAQAIAETS